MITRRAVSLPGGSGLIVRRVVADAGAEFARAAADITQQAARAVVVGSDPVHVAQRVPLREAVSSTRRLLRAGEVIE